MLAILCALIWGVNFSVIKIGLEHFPPFLLSAFRFLLVAIPAIFFLPRPDASFKDILLLGFVLGVVKFSFLFSAMSMSISAGISSVMS